MPTDGEVSVCKWCGDGIAYIRARGGEGMWVAPMAWTFYLTCPRNPDREHHLESVRLRAGHERYIPDLADQAQVERWLDAPY